MLMGREVRLHDGRLTTADGTLAGAHITMIETVRNAVTMMGATLEQALAMASRTPAAFLGLDRELGRVAPRATAPISSPMGPGLDVLGTWVGGIWSGMSASRFPGPGNRPAGAACLSPAPPSRKRTGAGENRDLMQPPQATPPQALPLRALPPQALPPQAFPATSLATELVTVRDIFRWAISRFNEAGLFFGHGTTTALDEAAFMVLEGLHLPVDQLEPFLDARLTMTERLRLIGLVDARVTTRKPAAYLVGRTYIGGIPFRVDERVIVPRSYLGEMMLSEMFEGEDLLPEGPQAARSVLELCTGPAASRSSPGCASATP